jgi:hypothetical protein
MFTSAESPEDPQTDYETLAVSPGATIRRARSVAARDAVRAFIEEQFMKHYGARVPDDSPELFGVFDDTDTLVAGFGLRTVLQGLFSQCYLDEDIVALVASHSEGRIAAPHIVELNHLSVAGPRVFRRLVPVLADMLRDMGFRGLVCTATSCLVEYFRRRRLEPLVLAPAHPGRLPPELVAQWGSYYHSSPTVVFGPLPDRRGPSSLQRLPGSFAA